jgi:hypothetical protein
MHYLFTMNAFEPLFWTGCAYIVVRIVKTGDQRLWLAFGALAGLGLQNKYSMAVWGFALMAGLLLSPERKAFATRWIWLGGVLAALIFLPNVVWNHRHGWPFLELMRNIRASGRDVILGPVDYVLHQVLNMNPASLPVWLGGLGWLLFSPATLQRTFSSSSATGGRLWSGGAATWRWPHNFRTRGPRCGRTPR